jgi:hypothetical protein
MERSGYLVCMVSMRPIGRQVHYSNDNENTCGSLDWHSNVPGERLGFFAQL